MRLAHFPAVHKEATAFTRCYDRCLSCVPHSSRSLFVSLCSLHTGGAPSIERQDPRFDSITKLMASIFNMCACLCTLLRVCVTPSAPHTPCGLKNATRRTRRLSFMQRMVRHNRPRQAASMASPHRAASARQSCRCAGPLRWWCSSTAHSATSRAAWAWASMSPRSAT